MPDPIAISPDVDLRRAPAPRLGRVDVRAREAASDTGPAPPLPHRVAKPWGYEIWYAVTDRYAGKILHVDRGHRLSLQFHERKDESCYVLAGKLRLVQGPSADELTERTLNPGDVWRNRPGDVHTIEALQDTDVLEVSTPDLDDVVRLRDDYGRQGTSAPQQ